MFSARSRISDYKITKYFQYAIDWMPICEPIFFLLYYLFLWYLNTCARSRKRAECVATRSKRNTHNLELGTIKVNLNAINFLKRFCFCSFKWFDRILLWMAKKNHPWTGTKSRLCCYSFVGFFSLSFFFYFTLHFLRIVIILLLFHSIWSKWNAMRSAKLQREQMAETKEEKKTMTERNNSMRRNDVAKSNEKCMRK